LCHSWDEVLHAVLNERPSFNGPNTGSNLTRFA
jgi:hypothetical protein